MLEIALCDDEEFMLEQLAQWVAGYFTRENRPASLTRFSSGMALLSSAKRFHIIFLDVQMEEPDGIETAKRLRSGGFDGFLIFVTIQQEAVFQAFAVQAFDYLIKPLEKERFVRTMDRLLRTVREREERRLLVQKGGERVLIPFEDLLYCEVINRTLYLHLRGGTVVDCYGKLEQLERKVDGRFFRCHRSYLINLGHVESWGEGQARLSGGQTVPVSRLRGEAFAAAMLRYMARWG